MMYLSSHDGCMKGKVRRYDSIVVTSWLAQLAKMLFPPRKAGYANRAIGKINVKYFLQNPIYFTP
jgi:hypothetical protein